MSMLTDKRFIKRRDVLKIFNIHRNTFANWIKTGKIKTTVINGHHYVPEDEIFRLLDERKIRHRDED
jgi:predicted site-specific integrase-resolvase